jgi:hypothetical protein
MVCVGSFESQALLLSSQLGEGLGGGGEDEGLGSLVDRHAWTGPEGYCGGDLEDRAQARVMVVGGAALWETVRVQRGS